MRAFERAGAAFNRRKVVVTALFAVAAVSVGTGAVVAGSGSTTKIALVPPSCVVPKVLGKSLANARAAITRAHCKVGSITRRHSSARKRGKVIGQSPAAGRRLRNGAKVNLIVGRG